MTEPIAVIAAKPSAIGLRHPDGAVLTKDGADWPNDSFTARRLTDGSVALKPADPPIDAPVAKSEATPAPEGPPAS